MTKLAKVAPDTKAGRQIHALERIMGILRDEAIKLGVAAEFYFSDSQRAGARTTLDRLKTSTDDAYDFERFFHYWGLGLWRQAPDGACPEDMPGPDFFRFGTENRLLWTKLLPQLLEALNGSTITVTADSSWRWDYDHPRANGRPRYVPCYQVFMSLSPTPLADGRKVAEGLLSDVCRAEHPPADEHLFDWQVDVEGTHLFSSYRWTPTGFVAHFGTKAKLLAAQGRLFKDLSFTVGHPEKGDWVAHVDLTKSNVVPQERALA